MRQRRALQERLECIAERMLEFADRFRSRENREKERQQFRELFVGGDYEEQGRKERLKTMSLCLVFLVLAFLFAFLAKGKEISTQLRLEENRLYREDDKRSVELEWKVKEQATEGKSDAKGGSVVLELKPQRVLPEKREELFKAAEEYVRDCIQGSNESLLQIRTELTFPEQVPGTEVTVRCIPGSYRWLNVDGSRTDRILPEEGAAETVTVVLEYYEETREFTLELWLLPKEDAEGRFRKQLETELFVAEADNRNEYLSLPKAVDGVAVEWNVKQESNATTILLLGVLATVCVGMLGKKQRLDRIREREQELMADYPELVSKYLLLLNAGMSSRAVWERIVMDYKKTGRRRYLYEEMALSGHEIENGISEAKVYENFGKRCRLLPFMRFSAVLVQNLQKGARGALLLLEQEAVAAFAERKETAKRKGEEAGTKLLLPMIGLLGIVLVIVLFPAFQSL